ncbi:hypothetical protein F66182_10175 [Fusarium sp. NRRL 66182]|nr:hypothetical protein F66182_10175 [Fusarium sp. NRRL 66182]
MSPQAEDWTNITDASERRKAQNRVAQRNYRNRQELRIELAQAILLDLPQVRSGIGTKGRRWLPASQFESQEIVEDLAALDPPRAAAVSEHDGQRNDIADLGAYHLLQTAPESDSNGIVLDPGLSVLDTSANN